MKKNEENLLICKLTCLLAISYLIVLAIIGIQEKQIVEVEEPEVVQMEMASNIQLAETEEKEEVVVKAQEERFIDCSMDIETQRIVKAICEEEEIEFCLVMAIIEHESQYNPNAYNTSSGCVGLMQINPYVWGKLECGDLWDIQNNVRCGCKILKYLSGIDSDEYRVLQAYATGSFDGSSNYPYVILTRKEEMECELYGEK